eukprot:gene15040-21111_t
MDPDNSKLYVGFLFFPVNCPLRFVMGPPRENKREAKQTVCMVAVQKLHRMGLIDDHLNPSWSVEVAALGAHGKWEGAGSKEVNHLMQNYPDPPDLVGTIPRVMLTQRIPAVLALPAVPTATAVPKTQLLATTVGNTVGNLLEDSATRSTDPGNNDMMDVQDVVRPASTVGTASGESAAMDDVQGNVRPASAVGTASGESAAMDDVHEDVRPSSAVGTASGESAAMDTVQEEVPPAVSNTAPSVPMHFYGYLFCLQGRGDPSLGGAVPDQVQQYSFLHPFAIGLPNPLPLDMLNSFDVSLPASETPPDIAAALSATNSATHSATSFPATVRIVSLVEGNPDLKPSSPSTSGQATPNSVAVSLADWAALGACHRVLRSAAMGAVSRKKMNAIALDLIGGYQNEAKVDPEGAKKRLQPNFRDVAKAIKTKGNQPKDTT